MQSFVIRSISERKESARQNKNLGVMNLPRSLVGSMEINIMSYSDRTEDRTHLKTADGSAGNTTPQLTESEKSRLAVIRREVGRGYALTLTDMRWLVELTERAGL